MSCEKFYVITGASGAGKSTLLNALGERGISVMPEAALSIVQEQESSDGTRLPGTDLQAVLAVLVDDLTVAVPSFLGLTMTLRLGGDPITLTAIDEDVVELSFTQASKPVVISGSVPAGGEDPGFRYLLMPRRLLS